MRTIKLIFAALALMLTTSTFASNPNNFEDKGKSITYEIEKMLKDSGLIIEEDFTVRVIFKLNEDRVIEVQAVKSPNEKMNEFLLERLNNQKLYGKGWFTEKIYELPIKVQAER